MSCWSSRAIEVIATTEQSRYVLLCGLLRFVLASSFDVTLREVDAVPAVKVMADSEQQSVNMVKVAADPRKKSERFKAVRIYTDIPVPSFFD
jgi:hypothetical protein